METKRGYLKYMDGVNLGCDPTPQTRKAVRERTWWGGSKTVYKPLEGDAQFPIVGTPERHSASQVEIGKLSDTLYQVRFVQADRYLSLTDEEQAETRATVGEHETLLGAEQPNGQIFLWRNSSDGGVLLLGFYAE